MELVEPLVVGPSEGAVVVADDPPVAELPLLVQAAVRGIGYDHVHGLDGQRAQELDAVHALDADPELRSGAENP